MLRLSLSGAGPRKGPQGRKMMAATIGKSKPNESRSFPDPSTTQDAVATHLLLHPHSDNMPSSAGFLSAYDDSLCVLSSDLSHTMYCLLSVLPVLDAASPTMECPLTGQELEKFRLLRQIQDQFLLYNLNQARPYQFACFFSYHYRMC